MHGAVETVFDSIPQFMAVCLVLAVAEAVYVLLGFGAGLIAVGSMALLMPEIRDVVVMLLLVNLPVELYVVGSSWRRIVWRGMTLIAVGIVLGLVGGTLVLRLGEPTFLLTILALFLLIAGGAFLITPRPRAHRLPRWVALPTGLSSGLLGGLFGTGGPPLIFYYQLRGVGKSAFRGTLMAVFLLMTPVRIALYGVADLLTVPRLWSALAVFPAVLAGAFIGNRIHLRIDEATFRRLVSIALVLIGAVLLIQRLR
jgi:uncharacterized membrane protein YfcA